MSEPGLDWEPAIDGWNRIHTKVLQGSMSWQLRKRRIEFEIPNSISPLSSGFLEIDMIFVVETDLEHVRRQSGVVKRHRLDDSHQVLMNHIYIPELSMELTHATSSV